MRNTENSQRQWLSSAIQISNQETWFFFFPLFCFLHLEFHLEAFLFGGEKAIILLIIILLLKDPLCCGCCALSCNTDKLQHMLCANSCSIPLTSPESTVRGLRWERIQALIPVLFLKPLSCILVACMLASPVLKRCYCWYFFSCRLTEKYS